MRTFIILAAVLSFSRTTYAQTSTSFPSMNTPGAMSTANPSTTSPATSATTSTATSTSSSSSTSQVELTPYLDAESTRPSVQLKVGADFATATGVNAAVELDLPVTPGFSFLTGLDFVQKGYGTDANADLGILGQGAVALTGRISYLEIPALAKFNFGNHARWSIFAGPYVAFKVGTSLNASATFFGQTTNVPVPDALTSTIGDQIANVDYGARAGVGGEVPLDRDLSVVAGAAYDFGLKNINDGVSAGLVSAYNRMVIVNVGIGLKI